jgi:hypothetical protein
MGLVKLTEIHRNNTITTNERYMLREVFINPEHVIMIREEARMQTLNEQGKLPSDLSNAHRFTKLTINRGHTGTDIVVVGAPDIVEKSLNQNNKHLLKG